MILRSEISRFINHDWKTYITMLINQMRIDIRNRYMGTFFGFFWAVLNPLLFTAIYSLVIVFVFHAKLSTTSTPLDYIVFMMSGLIPWLSFQEGVFSASNSVLANSNIVKNLPFPLEIFPLSGVLTSLVSLSVGLVLVFAGVLLAGRRFGLPLLFLPFAMLIQVYFTLGFGFFLASLSVFIRDISQLLTYIFMIVLYLSPVVYDISMLPLKILKQVSLVNPVYQFIAIYRGILYNNQMPDLVGIAYLLAFSTLSLVIGYRFFRRTKVHFSDYLA